MNNNNSKSEINDNTINVNVKFWLAISECNYLEISSQLRSRPELANWQDPLHGMSAVHYASKFGETSIIKLLLGPYKSNPNLKNNTGKTALHLAVEFNKVECAKLLKNTYNASSDIPDYSGYLPIHYANADAYYTYLGFLGSAKGFNKNEWTKKRLRSFDEGTPVKYNLRTMSKEESVEPISPRMRFNFASIPKKCTTHSSQTGFSTPTCFSGP